MKEVQKWENWEERYAPNAEKVLQNESRLSRLIENVKTKFDKLTRKNKIVRGVSEILMTYVQLIQSYRRGLYKDFPKKSLLLIIAALIYFVSPLDFIPDILPILGYADDASILIMVYKSVQDDLQKFKEWQRSQVVQ